MIVDPLDDHLYFPAGPAVAYLCETALGDHRGAGEQAPQREWWLVSAELADRLHHAGMPVLHFPEMHLWGRPVAPTSQDESGLRRALSRR